MDLLRQQSSGGDFGSGAFSQSQANFTASVRSGAAGGGLPSGASQHHHANTNTNKKRGVNIIRSLLARPHTPASCNRLNDTLIDTLRAEQEKENIRLADRARAIPWDKAPPRFALSPARRPGSAARRAGDGDGEFGAAERCSTPRSQDRATPSPRRPEIASFRAPGRGTPCIGQQAPWLSVHGQIDRVQRLCEMREEKRTRRLQDRAFLEAAVRFDDRERRSVTPRGSFLAFEENITAQAAATAVPLPPPPGRPASAAQQRPSTAASSANAVAAAAAASSHTARPMSARGAGASSSSEKRPPHVDDFFDDDDEDDSDADDGVDARFTGGSGGSSLAATDGSPESQAAKRKRPRQQNAAGDRDAGATSASHVPTKPDHSLPTDWSKQRDAAVFSAVRKLQQTADRLSEANVARTAQRIRQEHHARAADCTSFSVVGQPRSRTVRMQDPGTGTGAYGEEMDGIDGGAADEKGGAPAGGSARVASNARSGLLNCATDFYAPPVDVFRHIPSPRLAPREHAPSLSFNKAKAAAGGKSHNAAGGQPTTVGEVSSSFKNGLRDDNAAAAAAAKRSTPTLYVRTNHAAELMQSIRKRGLVTSPRMEPHRRSASNFRTMTARERLPLSAGQPSHVGFGSGLSLDLLHVSDLAQGIKRGVEHAPVLVSRPVPKPPPQCRLQSHAKYDQVQHRPQSAMLGSPPAARRPIVLGSPEKVNVKVPDKVVPETRDAWAQARAGGAAVTRTVIDCREPLKIASGIDVTHPRTVWDIRIPPDAAWLKKQQIETAVE